MIDVEAITTTYLDGQIATQVVPEAPDDTSEAWVKVTLIDSGQIAAKDQDHFNVYYLQLDCYPSGDGVEHQEEASDLCLEVREELAAMPAASHTGAVVTAVRFTGSRRMPDTEFKPPRQRYIVSADVYAHPA